MVAVSAERLAALLALILLATFHLIGSVLDAGRYSDNLRARYAPTSEFWMDVL
jgi:hypothetical protein